MSCPVSTLLCVCHEGVTFADRTGNTMSCYYTSPTRILALLPDYWLHYPCQWGVPTSPLWVHWTCWCLTGVLVGDHVTTHLAFCIDSHTWTSLRVIQCTNKDPQSPWYKIIVCPCPVQRSTSTCQMLIGSKETWLLSLNRNTTHSDWEFLGRAGHHAWPICAAHARTETTHLDTFTHHP